MHFSVRNVGRAVRKLFYVDHKAIVDWVERPAVKYLGEVNGCTQSWLCLAHATWSQVEHISDWPNLLFISIVSMPFWFGSKLVKCFLLNVEMNGC